MSQKLPAAPAQPGAADKYRTHIRFYLSIPPSASHWSPGEGGPPLHQGARSAGGQRPEAWCNEKALASRVEEEANEWAGLLDPKEVK